MKKKIMLFVMLLLLLPLNVNASIDVKYDDAINIVKEVMMDYYLKGESFQYNNAKGVGRERNKPYFRLG